MTTGSKVARRTERAVKSGMSHEECNKAEAEYRSLHGAYRSPMQACCDTARIYGTKAV